MHPRSSASVGRFLEALSGWRPEVAMGLETVHRAALDALNKRMTTDDFANAATIPVVLGVAARVRAHCAAIRAAGRTGRMAAGLRRIC